MLGYCGLRWGEAAALRVRHVDPLRGRLMVEESYADVNGVLILGSTKTHARRSVPVPRFICDELGVLLAGKGRDDLVFTSPRGQPLRLSNFRRRLFDRAVPAAGLDGLAPHGLRHTATSLAVNSGASVKAVQRMLGHKDAAMTLNVYADLFDDELDAVAERLDEAASRPVMGSRVAELWPERPVAPLAKRCRWTRKWPLNCDDAACPRRESNARHTV